MMNMEYEQSTGYFYIDGIRVATGFSGAPGHINNPADQCLADKGPLPRGHYKMTDAKGVVSSLSIRLTPMDGTDMCGRFGMLIHGDKIGNPGTGSTGCIILPVDIRRQILEKIVNNEKRNKMTILEVR